MVGGGGGSGGGGAERGAEQKCRALLFAYDKKNIYIG